MTTCWRVWTVFGAQSGRVSTDCLWYFSCMNKRCCPAGWCLRLLLRNTHAAFKCRQGKQDCKLKLSESRADRRWFPLFTLYFIQSSLFILLYLQRWFHLEDFLNQKVEESDKSLWTARCTATLKNQNLNLFTDVRNKKSLGSFEETHWCVYLSSLRCLINCFKEV